MGKTVKYLGFEPDFENDSSFWSKPKRTIEQMKLRQRLKRLAREKAEEAHVTGETWTHMTNHFLWGIKTDSRRRPR